VNQLVGLGPWGVEDVSRATGIPTRTLQRWHSETWAEARAVTSERGCLRYERDDVVRICLIETLKASGLGLRTGDAAGICDSLYDRLREVLYHEPRPKVTFDKI
jgi:hypothetical protein